MDTPARIVRSAFLCVCSAGLASCLKLEEPKEAPQPPEIVFGRPIVHAGSVPAFAIGALSGTGGTGANGAATTQEMEDGTFLVAVRLNIRPAEDDSFYTVWLTKPDGTDPVKVGRLRNPLGDGRHEIRFQSGKSVYGTHTRIVISLHKIGMNQTPGTPLAIGTLKPTTR